MARPADFEAHSSVSMPNFNSAAESGGEGEESRDRVRADESNPNKPKHQRFVVFIGT